MRRSGRALIVRDQIGVPALPELMPEALEPIRSGAIDLDLPDRIAVYGLTATDPTNFCTLRIARPESTLRTSGVSCRVVAVRICSSSSSFG